MFRHRKKIVAFLITILLISSMILTSFAGGWDVSSASNWAQGEIEEAYSYDLIPNRVSGNFKQMITRAEFASLVVRLYEKLTNTYPDAAPSDTFSDTSDKDVLRANKLGIVNGRGNGTFAPNDLVTRQEMAIMYYKALDKAYNKLGKTLNKTDGILTMNDKSKVASWAKIYVDFVHEKNIIKGSGGNFNPLGNAPREQAIIVLKRVYENYKLEKEEPAKKLDISAKSYINEEVNGKYIDYDKYKAVIFPWKYDGQNLDKLTGKKYYGGGKGTKEYFAIIGEVENLTLLKRTYSQRSTNKNTSEPTEIELGDGKFKDVIMEIEYNRDAGIETAYNIWIECDIRYPNGTLKHIKIDSSLEEYYGDKKDPILISDDAPEIFKIEKDGTALQGIKNYGGLVERGEDYLSLKYGNDSNGPLVLATDKNNNLVKSLGYGVYEAQFKFNSLQGNAGYAFNVSAPRVGNDKYKGYFVGIKPEDNTVFIGKANNNWKRIKAVKLPFRIKKNTYYNLKTVKLANRIDIYVNNKKYISVSDEEHIDGGYFGPRGYKPNVTYKYMGYDRDLGNLRPEFFGITNPDGDKLTYLRKYGGIWEMGENLTLIDDEEHKLGPMVLPLDKNGAFKKFPASAIYEAKFNITSNKDGNAGFVFNVSDPKIGNDQYKGYYIGVNKKKNTVELGKANNNWNVIKGEKIPFSISNGKIKLKVEKVSSAMTVYVNDHEIFTAYDETYKNDGGFGPRLWNTKAEYEYLKVSKLPY